MAASAQTQQHNATLQSLQSKSQDVGSGASQASKGGGPKVVGPNILGTLEEYRLERLLQNGLFGGVYEAKGLTSGRSFAVKVLHKSELQKAARASSLDFCEVPLSEIKYRELMLGHENVMQVEDYFEDVYCHYIVFELARGGDLLEALKLRPRGFEEHEAQYLIGQAALGLSRLHQRGLAMQDVSLENMLVHILDDGRFQVKVCDPGQATVFQVDAEHGEEVPVDFHGFVGKSFRPYELIMKRSYLASKVDAWCLGWSTFYLLAAQPLFLSADPAQKDPDWDLFKQGKFETLWAQKLGASRSTPRGSLGQQSPQPFARSKVMDFVLRLLDLDPKRRMSVTEALQHEWLADPAIRPMYGPKELLPTSSGMSNGRDRRVAPDGQPSQDAGRRSHSGTSSWPEASAFSASQTSGGGNVTAVASATAAAAAAAAQRQVPSWRAPPSRSESPGVRHLSTYLAGAASIRSPIHTRGGTPSPQNRYAASAKGSFDREVGNITALSATRLALEARNHSPLRTAQQPSLPLYGQTGIASSLPLHGSSPSPSRPRLGRPSLASTAAAPGGVASAAEDVSVAELGLEKFAAMAGAGLGRWPAESSGFTSAVGSASSSSYTPARQSSPLPQVQAAYRSMNANAMRGYSPGPSPLRATIGSSNWNQRSGSPMQHHGIGVASPVPSSSGQPSSVLGGGSGGGSGGASLLAVAAGPQAAAAESSLSTALRANASGNSVPSATPEAYGGVRGRSTHTRALSPTPLLSAYSSGSGGVGGISVTGTMQLRANSPQHWGIPLNGFTWSPVPPSPNAAAARSPSPTPASFAATGHHGVVPRWSHAAVA